MDLDLDWDILKWDLLTDLNQTLTHKEPPSYTFNTSGSFKVAHFQPFPLSFKISASLGLVCFVVFSSKKMRNPTNFLIANLALCDLLMALFCIPFSYVSVLLRRWPFGKFLCYFLSPAQAISILVSSYTLLALAVERYMAIIYPLRPKQGKRQACWLIVTLWVVAIVTASPTAVFTEYSQETLEVDQFVCLETGWEKMGVDKFKLPHGVVLMSLQYFLPLTVLIFTYSRIIRKVCVKQSLSEPKLCDRELRLAGARKKTVITSLVVVACYTLAWLPFHIVTLIGFRALPWQPEYIFFLCHFLAMAHSTYNPMIYAWTNSRFRAGFLAVLSPLHLDCRCMQNLCSAGVVGLNEKTVCFTSRMGESAAPQRKIGLETNVASSISERKTSVLELQISELQRQVPSY